MLLTLSKAVVSFSLLTWVGLFNANGFLYANENNNNKSTHDTLDDKGSPEVSSGNHDHDESSGHDDKVSGDHGPSKSSTGHDDEESAHGEEVHGHGGQATSGHDGEDTEEDGHEHDGDSAGHDGGSHDEKGHGDNSASHEEEGHGSEEGHGGEHEETGFGEGKAIIKVKGEGQMFQLSADSIRVLKISSKVVSKKGFYYEIPREALVEYQSKHGVFVDRNGWYSLLDLKIIKRTKTKVIISSKHLKSSDKIVITGVPLLRVAHMQASGQGGKGHAH